LTIIVYEMECQPTDDIGSVEIVVNGAPRRTPAEQTLLGLVGELGLEPERVAIEVDRRIVKRDQWATLRLRAGARIEIVQFVGGG
jgi:thiamine biosynthesis protein ThiS